MESALLNIVMVYLEKFKHISEIDWHHKISEDKWSKLEILGHLCDSAHNNMRRFIVTQYCENEKIHYEQDQWVSIQGYQKMESTDVVLMWKLLNEQIVRIIKSMPESAKERTCDTGKTTFNPCTLEFLIEDYIQHTLHHLSQIVNG